MKQVPPSTETSAQCRADFVKFIIDDQSHRELALRCSVKAHRQGKQHGFDCPAVQRRWVDFKAGWLACNATLQVTTNTL